MEANVLITSATLLDPRFKKLGFSDQRAADQVAQNLTAEITQMARSREASQTTATDSTNVTSEDSSRSDSVWGSLMNRSLLNLQYILGQLPSQRLINI